jgi:replication factor C subunit 3/5
LPKDDIIQFLNHISESEKLNISLKSLSCIQKLYKSDIRSMINFMQSNQDIVKLQNNEPILHIIDSDVWENIIQMIIKSKASGKPFGENIEVVKNYIHKISTEYNIDKKNIINDFLNYIIRNHSKYVSKDFLNFVENLLENKNKLININKINITICLNDNSKIDLFNNNLLKINKIYKITEKKDICKNLFILERIYN